MIAAKDRAYAAGLFEGEGCVYYGYNKYFSKKRGRLLGSRRIGIKISMTDKEPVDIFGDIFGMGSVRTEIQKTSGNKLVYTYCTTKFENVQFIICNMWEWLSPRRKQQYITALNRYLAKEGDFH